MQDEAVPWYQLKLEVINCDCSYVDRVHVLHFLFVSIQYSFLQDEVPQIYVKENVKVFSKINSAIGTWWYSCFTVNILHWNKLFRCKVNISNVKPGPYWCLFWLTLTYAALAVTVSYLTSLSLTLELKSNIFSLQINNSPFLHHAVFLPYLVYTQIKSQALNVSTNITSCMQQTRVSHACST